METTERLTPFLLFSLFNPNSIYLLTNSMAIALTQLPLSKCWTGEW
jgi:hypothetical protein